MEMILFVILIFLLGASVLYAAAKLVRAGRDRRRARRAWARYYRS